MGRRPIISFATSKGGSGKSTCLVTLAGVLADGGGRVAVIDTDPTQTVARWGERTGRPGSISVYSAETEDALRDAIDEASSKHHVILIDVEGRASIVGNMAMGKSSLVIVPVQPSEPDGHEAAKTIRAIKTAARAHEREIKFCAVMNRLQGAIRSRAYHDIVAQFQKGGVPVAASLIDREAYRRVFLEGGTLWTLGVNREDQRRPLEKAQREAYIFGEEIGRMIGLIRDGGGTAASDAIADSAPDTFRKAAVVDLAAADGETIDEAVDRRYEELKIEKSA